MGFSVPSIGSAVNTEKIGLYTAYRNLLNFNFKVFLPWLGNVVWKFAVIIDIILMEELVRRIDNGL